MNLSSFKTGMIFAVIAATLAIWLTVDHSSLQQLQAENAALRQPISQPAEAPPSTGNVADSDELEKLRREHVELLRLRGEVGVLRDRLEKQQKELTAAKAENAQFEAMRARSFTDVTALSLMFIGLAARDYATAHNGAFPTSFEQMTSELADVLASKRLGALNPGTDSFEIIDYGQALTAGAPPYYLFAREKKPRQMPDGNWSRVYLKVDGSIERAGMDNGDFVSWEKVWLENRAREAQAAAQISQ